MNQAAGPRIFEEMQRARKKFGPYNSTHEAYSVLQEEVQEFWDLVKSSKQDNKNKTKMIDELIQVAAVAIRTIRELENNEIKYV